MPFDIEDARARLARLEPFEPSAVQRDIAALARPRLTGTDGAAATERALRARFRDLGFEVRELPFSFSAVPGRYGLVFGGAVMAVSGALGAWLLTSGLPGWALAVLGLGLALALAPLLFLGHALDRLPWDRVATTNLLFTRPDSRPAWILMAHRDSKAQRVPTLLRTAAIGLGALAWVGLVALALLWIAGEPFRLTGLAWAAGAALTLAGLVLALCRATNASPGALDNATGLAALLAVAEREDATGDVAFLLTDGEELGLAGARAIAGDLPAVQGVVNIDGLDDDGPIYVSEGHGWSRRGSAPQLAAGLLVAGAALGLPVARRRLPRSLIVDHLPIAAAGMPALTLMRGRWSSLMRVHSPADRPQWLDGAGAADTARLVIGALTLLRDAGAGHLAGPRAIGS